MTTNVYDAASGTLICDSRWTIEATQAGKDFDIYVDDPGFEKLALNDKHVFMFAGRADMIELWKEYIATNPTDGKGSPGLNGIAVLIAKKGSHDIEFQYGHTIVNKFWPDGSRTISSFAGTGGNHAAYTWTCTKDLDCAMENAFECDPCSGGEIKFFNTVSNDGRVGECQGKESIFLAAKERGVVMYYKHQKFGMPSITEVPIQQAAAKDPEVQDVIEQLAVGRIDFVAPCESMYATPSLQDEQELEKALDRIFA